MRKDLRRPMTLALLVGEQKSEDAVSFSDCSFPNELKLVSRWFSRLCMGRGCSCPAHLVLGRQEQPRSAESRLAVRPECADPAGRGRSV